MARQNKCLTTIESTPLGFFHEHSWKENRVLQIRFKDHFFYLLAIACLQARTCNNQVRKFYIRLSGIFEHVDIGFDQQVNALFFVNATEKKDVRLICRLRTLL